MTNILNSSLQSESIVNQVVSAITDAIISGELKPGDKLPPEMTLCTSFGVGRNSIREAIKILTAYGVVYVKRPEGTFVSSEFSQKMLDPMLYGVLLAGSASSEIVQLRKVLDMGTLLTVISTTSEEQLCPVSESLAKLIQTLETQEPVEEDILQADIDFHMAITRATGNHLLLGMYEYVDRITIPSRRSAITKMLKESTPRDFIRLHEEMASILLQKDTQHMEAVLEEHYQYWKQVV